MIRICVLILLHLVSGSITPLNFDHFDTDYIRLPVAVRYCQQLAIPRHGFTTEPCANVAVGGLCIFQCQTGYEMKGYPTLHCQPGGIWSFNPPTCSEIVRCPDLSPPQYGAVSGNCTQASLGQSCIFSCGTEYKLHGSSVLYCNGQSWTSRPPICEQEPPELPPTRFYTDLDYTVRMQQNWPLQSTSNVCNGPPLYGVEWILSVRNADYGWEGQTHRAIIVLELNNYGSKAGRENEIVLMRHQLEVEITKALLRNVSTPIQTSELALFIQALLATRRNPRNFYGLDLVGILDARILSERIPHPSSVLALCSARAVGSAHLQRIRHNLQFPDKSCSHEKELTAIALKVFACAAEEHIHDFHAYKREMESAADALIALQKQDGGFGNVYTTALVVQALKTYDYARNWDEYSALEFLLSKQVENVNMLSTYYIDLALHAPRGLFKNTTLEKYFTDGFPTVKEMLRWPRALYVQYTIKQGEPPIVSHSVTLKIPANITFFDVMRIAAYENGVFNFAYHLGRNHEPTVYTISGIPNDAEDGTYWRLYRENGLSSKEITYSTVHLAPEHSVHYIYWYYDVFKNIPGVQY